MSTTPPKPTIDRIEELIHRRSSTDRKMSYIWMLVPLLPIVLGLAIAVSLIGVIISAVSKLGNAATQTTQASALPIVGAIAAVYAGGIVALFVVLLLGCFAFYNMIERRNAHIRRQQQLFLAIQTYLISSGNAKTGSISLLENSNEDSIFQERDRAAGLWSILYLFVTPIVGIIIAYNLTQDLRKHEELQVTAQAAISGALRDIGLPPLPATQYRAHKRDPLLFVILSLITAGLFWIYWFYVLLKDYNEHFSDQASFEDGLLNVLKPPPVRKYCSTCGGVLEGPARFCPHCGAKQAS